jgi:serine/threonine protein kinase
MTVTVEINGRTHTIDDSEPVGAGNEAIVHPMPDGRVIKLYSKPIKIGTPRGNDTLSKLRIMINRPPVTDDANGNKVLAWPQEVALQPASLHGVMLAGFTMPRVGGDEYRSIFNYWNPKTRRKIVGPTATQRDIDRLLEGIIANMINNVNGIHEQGYIIGDINEKNILVGPNALINIIDCDSFQVKGYKGIFYKCPVGRPEYTSPRLHSELKQICTDTRCSHQPGQKRSYSCLIRTKEDDAFALAVMLYQLLMEGWHPYNDGTGSNVQEKILSVRPLCVTDPSQMPVPARERWHKLNDTWQNYFQDTLTGTSSWTEDEIPGTDRIFKTKGFRPQVIIETEESAKPESTPSKKVLPVPDRQEAARIALRRALIALMDSDRNGKAAAEIELHRALKAVWEAFPNSTEYSRAMEAVKEAAETEYLEVSRAREAEREGERQRARKEREVREAAQNKPSTPSNVCPNCLNPFEQGEVYCQTANCITVLQTKTSPCIGCGKPIPSTVNFCRYCGLRQ